MGHGGENSALRQGCLSMRFLLDMNVPPSLETTLQKEGHEVRHVMRIGLAQASDSTIIEVARETSETSETIVTHDLDYSHLMAF